MNTMIQRLLLHPWGRAGKIEWVCCDLLMQISSQSDRDMTDLTCGTLAPLDEVWEDIEQNGMKEPFMIRINPTRQTIRLESGNHRLKKAIARGHKFMPCATFITQKIIFHPENGLHEHCARDFINWNGIFTSQYDYQVSLKELLRPRYRNLCAELLCPPKEKPLIMPVA